MVAKNPALLQWINAAPVDTEKLKALDMGTALHCKLLEPEEFSKRFILAPEFNRRTTAGKEAEAAFLKDCEHTGKTVMDAEQGRKLQLMRDSVMAHPAARWLLEAEGHCESSFYWTDPETGELCRCRPDRYLSDHPVIVDVKKVADMDRLRATSKNSAITSRCHVPRWIPACHRRNSRIFLLGCQRDDRLRPLPGTRF